MPRELRPRRNTVASTTVYPRGDVAPVTRGRENEELTAVEDIIEGGQCMRIGGSRAIPLI